MQTLFLRPVELADLMKIMKEDESFNSKAAAYSLRHLDELFTSSTEKKKGEEALILQHIQWIGFLTQLVIEDEMFDFIEQFQKARKSNPEESWQHFLAGTKKISAFLTSGAVPKFVAFEPSTVHDIAKFKLSAITKQLAEQKCRIDPFASLPLHALRDVLYSDYKMHQKMYENPKMFVVLLLDEKKHYLGHVYLWIDLAQPKLCKVMRIRSSIENLLLNTCNLGSKGIAKKLLEGARRLCIQLCDKKQCALQVEFPIGPMPFLLSQLGFVPQLEGEEIGEPTRKPIKEIPKIWPPRRPQYHVFRIANLEERQF